jgi:uncharacterized membrane protein YcaP (DUF421 family)
MALFPLVALLQGPTVAASMWDLSRPWGEFVARGLLVYGFLLLLLRLQGKRQVGQLAPFDLVLLLVLSNAVQNAMNAGDNTVAAGFILVLTLMGVHALISFVSVRHKGMEALLEGKPRILVHHGAVDEDMLRRERITRHELMAALRQAGLVDLDQVQVAILETNGRINVIAGRGERPA